MSEDEASDEDVPAEERSTSDGTEASGQGSEHSPGRAHRHDQVRRWRREGGPEFDRVAFFTDAVYAIALTLLALDLRIDVLPSPQDAPATMWHALDDLLPKIVGYVVGFILLGRYWIAHHTFFSRLGAVNHRLIVLNLTYLGFVALLPFPTSLLGEWESNPVSVILFALNLAAISGLETVALWYAYRAKLMRHDSSDEVQRWELLGSIEPAIMFVVTIPLAFISPTFMLLSWIAFGVIAGRVLANRRPAGATDN